MNPLFPTSSWTSFRCNQNIQLCNAWAIGVQSFRSPDIYRWCNRPIKPKKNPKVAGCVKRIITDYDNNLVHHCILHTVWSINEIDEIGFGVRVEVITSHCPGNSCLRSVVLDMIYKNTRRTKYHKKNNSFQLEYLTTKHTRACASEIKKKSISDNVSRTCS